MPNISWNRGRPPASVKGKRLLLIVDASGSPPDKNLMGKSEIMLGYWTGDHFRSMIVDQSDFGSKLPATHWTEIDALLPDGVQLRHQRALDSDVR